MKTWICKTCGWIYDEAAGAPNTRWRMWPMTGFALNATKAKTILK